MFLAPVCVLSGRNICLFLIACKLVAESLGCEGNDQGEILWLFAGGVGGDVEELLRGEGGADWRGRREEECRFLCEGGWDCEIGRLRGWWLGGGGWRGGR